MEQGSLKESGKLGISSARSGSGRPTRLSQAKTAGTEYNQFLTQKAGNFGVFADAGCWV